MNEGDMGNLDAGRDDHVPAGVEAALTYEALWAEPDVDLWSTLSATIAVETGHAPVSLAAARRRRRFWPVPVAAAAVVVPVVLAGAIGFVWGGARDAVPQPDAVFAISGTELNPEASGVGAWRKTPSGLEIRLDVSGLPAPPDNAYYQGWLKGDDSVVTIGTFHARRGGDDIVLWSGLENVDKYHTLTVTLQKEGAGPLSSGVVVMTGTIDPAE